MSICSKPSAGASISVIYITAGALSDEARHKEERERIIAGWD